MTLPPGPKIFFWTLIILEISTVIIYWMSKTKWWGDHIEWRICRPWFKHGRFDRIRSIWSYLSIRRFWRHKIRKKLEYSRYECGGAFRSHRVKIVERGYKGEDRYCPECGRKMAVDRESYYMRTARFLHANIYGRKTIISRCNKSLGH